MSACWRDTRRARAVFAAVKPAWARSSQCALPAFLLPGVRSTPRDHGPEARAQGSCVITKAGQDVGQRVDSGEDGRQPPRVGILRWEKEYKTRAMEKCMHMFSGVVAQP